MTFRIASHIGVAVLIALEASSKSKILAQAQPVHTGTCLCGIPELFCGGWDGAGTKCTTASDCPQKLCSGQVTCLPSGTQYPPECGPSNAGGCFYVSPCLNGTTTTTTTGPSIGGGTCLCGFPELFCNNKEGLSCTTSSDCNDPECGGLETCLSPGADFPPECSDPTFGGGCFFEEPCGGGGLTTTARPAPDERDPMVGGVGGDPHFHTFNGEYFGYHGVCDLVMARSSSFGSGLGLDLHIRTEEREGYSSISNAAVRIGSDVLEVSKDATVYVNGVPGANLPTKLAGLYEVTKEAGANVTDESNLFLHDVNHGFTKTEINELMQYKVDLGVGDRIEIKVWKGFIWVNVRGSSMNFEDNVGLMGAHGFRGKLIARDGVTDLHHDTTAYGEEWQVLDTEPKLFSTLRAPQHPDPCLPPPEIMTSRRLGEQSRAEDVCANVKGPTKEFCIFDVMVTGDPELAHAYQ